MKTFISLIAGACLLTLPVDNAFAVKTTKVKPGYIQPVKERVVEAEDQEQPPAEQQEAAKEPSSPYPDFTPDGDSSNPLSAVDSSDSSDSSLSPGPDDEPGTVALPAPVPDDPNKIDPP